MYIYSNVFKRYFDPSVGQNAREYQIDDGEKLEHLVGYDCNNL